MKTFSDLKEGDKIYFLDINKIVEISEIEKIERVSFSTPDTYKAFWLIPIIGDRKLILIDTDENIFKYKGHKYMIYSDEVKFLKDLRDESI